MKKFLYSLLAVATLVSCGGDEGPEVEVVPEGPETIEASNFTIETTEGLSFAWENESKVSVFRSNTLAHRFEVEAVYQRQDAQKQVFPAFGVGKQKNRAIDLCDIDGVFAKADEGGVPAADIVQRDGEAKLFHLP